MSRKYNPADALKDKEGDSTETALATLAKAKIDTAKRNIKQHTELNQHQIYAFALLSAETEVLRLISIYRKYLPQHHAISKAIRYTLEETLKEPNLTPERRKDIESKLMIPDLDTELSKLPADVKDEVEEDIRLAERLLHDPLAMVSFITGNFEEEFEVGMQSNERKSLGETVKMWEAGVKTQQEKDSGWSWPWPHERAKE
jgi:hypothetical protein